MNEKLNAERVNEVFIDCLAGEQTEDMIIAEGIQTKVGFNKQKIKGYEKEIELMLNELPEQFKKSKGGGWSFLNACQDKNGFQWTGSHQRMEQLFQLGIAIKKAICQMPRNMWQSLPGGMPYYTIVL